MADTGKQHSELRQAPQPKPRGTQRLGDWPVQQTSSDTVPLEQHFSALSIDDNGLHACTVEVQFNPAQCLFCRCRSVDLGENLSHMQKAHSLVVPDADRLAVDLETLIEYFHLVIFGYFECLFCGSRRSDVQAAQQHMLGKGHCKIDIENRGSEYRGFYDVDSSDDDRPVRHRPHGATSAFVDTDKSMRLPSGKVLSHRAQAKSRPPRSGARVQTEAAAAPPTVSISTWSAAAPIQVQTPDSRRVARREAVFQTQLATLRESDRKSLVHLPAAQQRAIVIRGKKLVEQARRVENEMLLKIQLKANRAIKK